jgi:hypothetical protein
MSFILQPDRKAAEAAAPRNECALKILLLIPDNSNTDLSHRAIIVFHIQKRLMTSRPGVSLPAIVLKRYEKPELCVVKTLLSYIIKSDK